MDTNISQILVFGILAIIAGVFFVFAMMKEMSVENKRKWYLGIGLSTGIIAFGLKIIMIIGFTSFSKPILGMFGKRELVAANTPNMPSSNAQPTITSGYQWQALPAIAPYPDDNPTTAEKIALGKRLFFDKRLSRDNTFACASCHELNKQKGGGDGLATSIGINGQQGSRNAPTVFNAAFQQVLFWDGRAKSLEQQAKGPIINPIEMGMPTFAAVENKLKALGQYQDAFAKAFPKQPEISIDNIAKAIAAYERTLITPNSAYDRFIHGDKNALNKSQKRGMALFESTGCVLCHSGPNFSGASVFASNLLNDFDGYRIFPAKPDAEFEKKYQFSKDLGAVIDKKASKQGLWRIPSLRNISLTAPYFHNGSVKSLEEAVRIMAKVQLDKRLSNKGVDDKNSFWQQDDKQFFTTENNALSDKEVEDIVAFLHALEGDFTPYELRQVSDSKLDLIKMDAERRL